MCSLKSMSLQTFAAAATSTTTQHFWLHSLEHLVLFQYRNQTEGSESLCYDSVGDVVAAAVVVAGVSFQFPSSVVVVEL